MTLMKQLEIWTLSIWLYYTIFVSGYYVVMFEKEIAIFYEYILKYFKMKLYVDLFQNNARRGTLRCCWWECKVMQALCK